MEFIHISVISAVVFTFCLMTFLDPDLKKEYKEYKQLLQFIACVASGVFAYSVIMA